jgi:hypothetical protein
MSQDVDVRSPRPWCLFRCGVRSYAVPVGSVAEIVPIGKLAPLPLGPASLLGLCAFRRDVIPIVDLAEDGIGGDHSARHAILVLRDGHGAWGIRIDREGILMTDGGTPPAESGPIRRGTACYEVLDLAASWRRVRTALEGKYGGAGVRTPVLPSMGDANETPLHSEADT